MSDLNGRLKLVFSTYGNLENEAQRQEMVELLETILEELNTAAQNGEDLVSDGVYDTCKEYLQALSPNSPILHHVWSVDDPQTKVDEKVDRFLFAYPMTSIRTVKHMTDIPVRDMQGMLPVVDVEVIAPVKLNGHGIRFVYQYGRLVSATTRGRSTAGKDLKLQISRILGEYIPALEKVSLVEFRGEAMLPFHNLQRARDFNPDIKSAFSGVSSMIRASATEEETKLLDIVCYDVLSDDLSFQTLEDKYLFIQSLGFKIPVYVKALVNRRTLHTVIDQVLVDMEKLTENYHYYTDGVVFTINDLDYFTSFGQEESFRYGNIALKMGRWKQDDYVGVIDHIEWTEGKSKLTPVAILQEPVETMTGNSVTNVPLYAPLYILILEAYPNFPIRFKYGGEAGVVPVTHDGKPVKELTLESWGEVELSN